MNGLKDSEEEYGPREEGIEVPTRDLERGDDEPVIEEVVLGDSKDERSRSVPLRPIKVEPVRRTATGSLPHGGEVPHVVPPAIPMPPEETVGTGVPSPVISPLPGALEEELHLPPPMPSKPEERIFEKEEPWWRADIKWAFGVLAALFLLAALLFAGLYRVGGYGNTRKILEPLLTNVTKIDSIVRENYEEIRATARSDEDLMVLIPDLGINVTIQGADIIETDLRGLQEMVKNRVIKYIYTEGYKGSIPLETASGSGESRGRAIIELTVGVFSEGTHNSLIWPLAIAGALALAFAILLLIFARGWGRAAAVGLVLICAGLPFSSFFRFGNEILWKTSQAYDVYKQGVHRMLTQMCTLMVIYFDIALVAGAVLLLIGVIGGLRTRRRTPKEIPFAELD